MKRCIRVLLAGLCIMAAVSTNPMKADAEKSTPGILSEAACVMDIQSGTVLYDKNMNQKEYPASITKIMTTLVALENSSLSEEVEYRDETAYANWESNASNIEIKNGERISMEESLYAIMLESANEVCNGVGVHVSGSIDNFVKKMNEKAKALGCKNTHFENPNGLWRKTHYTTPYDMALIGREAMRNKDFRTIAGTKRYLMSKTNKRKEGYPLANHHEMLNPDSHPEYGYEYCVGGKTGYTIKSRNTLVTFAKKGDMELVCVIMKCDATVWQDTNHYTDTTRLLNYCFENYEKILLQDNVASDINEQHLFTRFSPFYNTETSSLQIEENAGVILPKGVKLDQAQKKIEFYDTPLELDDRRVIGRISYTYGGKEVGGTYIYYDETHTFTLKDSIDMSKWFGEAIETAKKEPFPWKKLVLVIILVICVVAITAFCVIKIRNYQIQTASRRWYKKNRHRMRKRDREFYTKHLK